MLDLSNVTDGAVSKPFIDSAQGEFEVSKALDAAAGKPPKGRRGCTTGRY